MISRLRRAVTRKTRTGFTQKCGSLPIEKEATELPIAGLGTVLISVRSIYIEF